MLACKVGFQLCQEISGANFQETEPCKEEKQQRELKRSAVQGKEKGNHNPIGLCIYATVFFQPNTYNCSKKAKKSCLNFVFWSYATLCRLEVALSKG